MRELPLQKPPNNTIPVFKASAIDLSVEWGMIFKGAIRGSIIIKNPELNFLSGRHKNEDLKQDSSDFRQLLESFMPLTMNRLEIMNGQIRYIDLGSEPIVDKAMTNISVVATNFTNVVDRNELLPSSVDAYANTNGGSFRLNAKFNPLYKQPTFELTTELKNMNLVPFNDFLKAYGNFALKNGQFSVYAEFAGEGGNFGG